MYWVFGLLTGLMFDMPWHWWVLGFLLGVWNSGTNYEKAR